MSAEQAPERFNEDRALQEGPPADRYVEMMLRQIPGVIWSTDRELRVTFARGRGLVLRGLTADQVIGMTVEEFVRPRAPSTAPSDAQPIDPALAAHLSALAGTAQRCDYTLAGRIFDLRVEPLRIDDGAVIGCVGMAIDITERRRTEDELANKRRLLEEAQRMAHVGS